MKHVLYKTGDPDAPDAIKDRNGEVVLDLCRLCGQTESTLEEDCPAMVWYYQGNVHKGD